MNTGIAMSRVRLGDLEPVEWMGDGACRDPRRRPAFDATMALEKASKVLRGCEIEALRVCAGCPVLEDCREWALKYDVAGVAGGLTYWDRKKLSKGPAA